ncbi:MAG: hypothetical protein KTR17_03545 [Cellvibrionaceae bacterium]|nr:hypothetical protein [Cellvibrionaceae bacterium]
MKTNKTVSRSSSGELGLPVVWIYFKLTMALPLLILETKKGGQKKVDKKSWTIKNAVCLKISSATAKSPRRVAPAKKLQESCKKVAKELQKRPSHPGGQWQFLLPSQRNAQNKNPILGFALYFL